MTPAMDNALKHWADQQRGRAAKLADDLGVSRPYISDIVNGKKSGSVEIMRKIADYTGIAAADLIGATTPEAATTPGLSEPALVPFSPATGQTAAFRATIRSLYPQARTPGQLIAHGAQPAFGVLHGDLLIFEQQFKPEDLTSDHLVIAQVLSEAGTATTTLGRLARPWIIGHDTTVRGAEGTDASVVGIVLGILRGTSFTNARG